MTHTDTPNPAAACCGINLPEGCACGAVGRARNATPEPAQTAVDRVEIAARAAGLTVTRSSVSRIVHLGNGPDWLRVRFDAAGRLISAERSTISGLRTMPAAGLEARVLTWIDEHRPAPTEVDRPATESASRAAFDRPAPTADPLSDEALIKLAAGVTRTAAGPTYSQRVATIAATLLDTAFPTAARGRISLDALVDRAHRLIAGTEVVDPADAVTLPEAAELVAREALRLHANARLAEMSREHEATQVAGSSDPAMVQRRADRAHANARPPAAGTCGPACMGWCVLDGVACNALVNLVELSGPGVEPGAVQVTVWDPRTRRYVPPVDGVLTPAQAAELRDLLNRFR